jgi:hypothetical protein
MGGEYLVVYIANNAMRVVFSEDKLQNFLTGTRAQGSEHSGSAHWNKKTEPTTCLVVDPV